MSRRPTASDDTEQGFLNRWSRRKRGLEAPDQDAPESPEPEARGAGPEPETAEEPVKTDEDMPDIETIDETTDMSDFFSPGVSEHLRNQALRRLFHLSKFNVTDGLDDYCENFRNFQPLGDIVTADMRHRMEVERERLARAAEEEAAAEPSREVDQADAGSAEEAPGDHDPAPEAVADADQPRAVDDPDSDTGEESGART